MVPRLKLCIIDFIRRAFDCFRIGGLCGENEAYIADCDGCTSAIHRATSGLWEGFVKLDTPSQHNTIQLNTTQHTRHNAPICNTPQYNTPSHSTTQHTNKQKTISTHTIHQQNAHTNTKQHNMTTHTAHTPLYTHIYTYIRSHLKINVQ